MKLDQPIEICNSLYEMYRDNTGFILLTGPNGTGKTFAAKFVYEFFVNSKKNREATLTTQSELNLSFNKVQSEYGQTYTYMEELRKKDLFVLDDLGTRTPSEAFMDFIYAIIDYRWHNNLATIITTNLNADKMREKFGDAFTSRICSGKIFKTSGKDRRMIHHEKIKPIHELNSNKNFSGNVGKLA